MTNDSSTDVALDLEEPASPLAWFRVGDLASWLFPLLGLLAFEWFANPVVAVIIACLKFGYADFRTALWLRGDPVEQRGRALSLCYVARGLYVVAGWAFVITFAIGLCEPLFRPNQLANLDAFLAGLVMWFSGVFLGTAMGGLALSEIARHGLRVWMDPTIHRARRENRRWSVCHGHRNGFRSLCAAVGSIGTSVMGFVLVACLASGEIIAILVGLLVWGYPCYWCVSSVWRSWSLAAQSPEECWGE